MRSPPWVVPKQKEPFGKAAYAKWAPALFKAIPGLGRATRTLIFLGAELDFFNLIKISVSSARARKKTESDLLMHMRNTVPHKYHEILTPNYAVGCKRRIYDIDWFPSLNDPKIHLTTQPLTSVQPRGVTLGPNRTYPRSRAPGSKPPAEVHLPADVIILSNGFDITKFHSSAEGLRKNRTRIARSLGGKRGSTSVHGNRHGRLSELLHGLRSQYGHWTLLADCHLGDHG